MWCGHVQTTIYNSRKMTFYAKQELLPFTAKLDDETLINLNFCSSVFISYIHFM